MSKDDFAEKVERIIELLKDYEKRITELERRMTQYKGFSNRSNIFIDKNIQIKKLMKWLESFIKLDATEGVIFITNSKKWSHSQIILLYLSGKAILHSINKNFKDSANLDELVEKLFLKRTTIRGRLSELHRKNLVLKEKKGIYKVNLAFVDNIIEFIQKT